MKIAFWIRLVYVALVSNCTVFIHADIITDDDIRPAIPNSITSGNETLDLQMFAFSGGSVENSSGLFDGDDGNRELPHGGGADIGSFAESYVTTAGKLKDFYRLNFPSGGPNGSTITELALFIDLNETGPVAQATNSLKLLDIVLNPTSVNGGADPVNSDVSSSSQEIINQTYTGGTLLANLSAPTNLPVINQGSGFSDYVIFTGIDLFALNDSDVLLFNISMDTLNNGSEDIFLSGRFQAIKAIPEPGLPLLLLMSGTMAFALGDRRKNANYHNRHKLIDASFHSV